MTVGLTNGCFDLLHDGHRYLLRECRNYCDWLIVAVNTDDSVKRLKGVGRPVQKLEERMAALMALDEVDAVLKFETEKELLDIIREQRPSVLIKGSDYFGLNITGAGLVTSRGGKVIRIPLLAGVSTTQLINSNLLPVDTNSKQK